MNRRLIHLALILPLTFTLCQCSSMKPEGGTPVEQRAFIDSETNAVVERLKKQDPKSVDDLANSEGVAAFKYASGKLPLILGGLGAGSGYGVAYDNAKTEDRTYMKVSKYNWGFGMGVKDQSVVFVFQDRAVFDKFRSGKWDGGAGAEATVKAGEAGGGIGGTATPKKGFNAYTLTEAGMSYGVTYQARRFSPIKSLNR